MTGYASKAAGMVIAGGGIIGGAIAWRLAQAGAAVTLVDAGKMGGEASWAGAGMLAPGGEIGARSGWAEFALESLALYPAFVEELSGETGVAIDYRRCGALEMVHTESEWEELGARRAAQAELGIRSERAEGGFFYPDDALVDPRDITKALRRACERRGVRIIEGTRVLALRMTEEGATVDTSAGLLTGEAAVLSAGAWSGSMAVSSEGAPVKIRATFPVRGHLLGYQLEPGAVGPILRHGHTYVMQRSSGFLIAGTTSEQVGFDRTVDPRMVADIRLRACELLPRLRAEGDPVAWLGFRPATEGFEPAIGRAGAARLWLAYGHYRNGILLAPATAKKIASEILAERK